MSIPNRGIKLASTDFLYSTVSVEIAPSKVWPIELCYPTSLDVVTLVDTVVDIGTTVPEEKLLTTAVTRSTVYIPVSAVDTVDPFVDASLVVRA